MAIVIVIAMGVVVRVPGVERTRGGVAHVPGYCVGHLATHRVRAGGKEGLTGGAGV
jgi:hypothetical protein